MSQLPLFGYTVYVVLRMSKQTLPGPGLLGLNHQHLILMDPSSQVRAGMGTGTLGHSSPPTTLGPSPGGAELCVSAAPRHHTAPSP